MPNRRCQRPHDCPLSHSLDTEHNRRVIIERGLENLPQKTLIMLILASADPSKTVRKILKVYLIKYNIDYSFFFFDQLVCGLSS